MPWLEDLKFPRGYQMGTHINKLLSSLMIIAVIVRFFFDILCGAFFAVPPELSPQGILFYYHICKFCICFFYEMPVISHKFLAFFPN